MSQNNIHDDNPFVKSGGTASDQKKMMTGRSRVARIIAKENSSILFSPSDKILSPTSQKLKKFTKSSMKPVNLAEIIQKDISAKKEE